MNNSSATKTVICVRYFLQFCREKPSQINNVSRRTKTKTNAARIQGDQIGPNVAHYLGVCFGQFFFKLHNVGKFFYTV
jgi:hypothetical protein